MKIMNKSLFFALSVIIHFSPTSAADEATCTVSGMQGTYPSAIDTVIKAEHTPGQSVNAVLLHGPAGVGKATLVRSIAEEKKVPFQKITTSDIVGTHNGESAKNIREIVTSLRNKGAAEGKRAILLIDEIDAIGMMNESEFYSEYEMVKSELGIILDDYKNDAYILVVGTTTAYEKLDPRFVSRFGSNIILIKNPNAKNRRAVISHYNTKFKANLTEAQVSDLVKETKSLSQRNIKFLLKGIVGRSKAEPNTALSLIIAQGLAIIKQGTQLGKKKSLEDAKRKELELENISLQNERLKADRKIAVMKLHTLCSAIGCGIALAAGNALRDANTHTATISGELITATGEKATIEATVALPATAITASGALAADGVILVKGGYLKTAATLTLLSDGILTIASSAVDDAGTTAIVGGMVIGVAGATGVMGTVNVTGIAANGLLGTAALFVATAGGQIGLGFAGVVVGASVASTMCNWAYDSSSEKKN